MTEWDASRWKAYVSSESVPGTTNNNASFTFIGACDSVKIKPTATYKQIRASGSKDFYGNQQLSIKPQGSIKVIPANVATLVNYVTADQAFTLLLRNPTDGLYIRYVGCYIDKIDINIDIEDDITFDIDFQAYELLTTNAPGTPTIPSDSTTALKYTNASILIGAAGGSLTAITDITTAKFTLDKQMIRLLNSSTGVTRQIFSVARTHSLTMTRTMDVATGLNELGDVAADTAKDVKLLLTNVSGGSQWSVKLGSAKTEGPDFDPLKPEEAAGRDLEYIGTGLVFATS